MQTFLPYPDFEKSIRILDSSRRNKQAVESSQLITVLDSSYKKFFPHRNQNPNSKGWINHPAVKLWKGYLDALILYYNINLEICIEEYGVKFEKLVPLPMKNRIACLPPWFGWELFHLSHRSNLLSKKPEYYKNIQGFIGIPDDLGYLWLDNKHFLDNYNKYHKITLENLCVTK